jgi:hypothetical protein
MANVNQFQKRAPIYRSPERSDPLLPKRNVIIENGKSNSMKKQEFKGIKLKNFLPKMRIVRHQMRQVIYVLKFIDCESTK